MIDYSKTNPGAKLRITGMGAPGFAKLGDIVTVTNCNGTNRCDVVNEKGESAYFALSCGAQRLEPACTFCGDETCSGKHVDLR
jgi:hypothetical protein